MIYVRLSVRPCLSTQWAMNPIEKGTLVPHLKEYRLIRRLIPPLAEEAQDFIMNRYVTFIQIPVFEHQSFWTVSSFSALSPVSVVEAIASLRPNCQREGGDRRSGRKKNPHILSFTLVPIIYSCT